MAGHSKWANIKFRKAAQDAKRGKLFTKLIREITVSARSGGGDSASNPRLRTAIDKALGANMTRDTVDRAIKRGTGELEGVSYEEIRYEGYAPGGVAVLVDTMTDNRNRTVAEVRHAFTKCGGNLGTDGSVDASVTIRTAWIPRDVPRAQYWSGGAVVWDSDPVAEYEEAWRKAAPFLAAVGATAP